MAQVRTIVSGCKNGAEDRSGFTLLEVLVSIALLAIGMTILLQAHRNSVSISNYTRKMSVAAALARDVMTEFEMQGYPSVGTETGDFEIWYPTMYPGYAWAIDVNESMFGPYVRDVEVRVAWTENPEVPPDFDDEARMVMIASFIAALNEEDQETASSESSGSMDTDVLGAYQNAAAAAEGGAATGTTGGL